jgi:hypothetical protein
MMDLASKIVDRDFSEDQVDGGVEGICVETDEDMIVAMCYISECISYGRTVELETFNVELERNKVIDTFLTLLSFS